MPASRQALFFLYLPSHFQESAPGEVGEMCTATIPKRHTIILFMTGPLLFKGYSSPGFFAENVKVGIFLAYFKILCSLVPLSPKKEEN